MAEITDRLLASYCRAAGTDPSIVDRPGVTVAGEADRAGTGVVSAYLLGGHLLLRCDPSVVERCRERFTPDDEPTLEHFEAGVADAEERYGRGLVHVVSDPPAAAAGIVRVLDAADRSDRAHIGALIEADPEGAEFAEIELEALDEHMVGVPVDDGLGVFASERPWDIDPLFADVGVLTHPDHRRKGLAACAVSELCHRVWAAGRLPLYRCDATNLASKALAARIGFVEAATLSAVRF